MKIKMRIENLTKIFGRTPYKNTLELLEAGISKEEILEKTNHVIGVNNASFDVKEGEIFVVMGLSGSGKSTLIRCLNRLYEPTMGSVFIDDQDVTKANKETLRQIRRTKMAMVFQHFGLFPHKTVGYNVSYGLRVRGISEAEQRRKAEEALAMVGLKSWIDHYIHSLSGGMQQRVGLARALATDADVLLMDEAFSALDPLIRRQMQDELVRLQERLHKTIVFITHDLNEALRVGDRVAIMRNGVIEQIGTPTEIVIEPATEYVARFMSDVDQSRVLSAEFAMSPAHQLKNTVTSAEALEKMKTWQARTIYIVDKAGRVDGLVSRNYLENLPPAKLQENVQKALMSNFPRASRFDLLTDLYQLYKQNLPVAVLDDIGKLLGVVYPYDIISALATAEKVALEVDTPLILQEA